MESIDKENKFSDIAEVNYNITQNIETKLWNPKGFIAISLIFSFLPAAILYSLNYGRLGFYKKRNISLFISFVVFMLLISLAYFTDQNTLRSISYALNIGAALYMKQDQFKAFENHVLNGGRKASYVIPVIITIFITTILIVSMVHSSDTPNQSKVYSSTAHKTNTLAAKSQDKTLKSAASANTVIDYNQFIKKVWVQAEYTEELDTNRVSFCISKIANGKITLRINLSEPAVPDGFPSENITGTVTKDIAKFQFDYDVRTKANMTLLFKSSNEIEATIKLDHESDLSDPPPKGIIEFRPYNLKNDLGKICNLTINRSFMVNLNSWGNVKFISAKSGDETVLYLTNKHEDIIYNLNLFNIDDLEVKDFAFIDINKDKLKDFIIIGKHTDGSIGGITACICLQNADGEFAEDILTEEEINDTVQIKNIKSVTNYISKNYKRIFSE